MVEDRNEQLIEIVSAFCDENLNDEIKNLSVKWKPTVSWKA